MSPLLGAGIVFAALMIGLRFEVGADWPTYKLMFSYAGYADLGRVLAIGDPGYQFLNWAVRQLDVEIWLVNLICAGIFAWGLFRFAQVQPNPWLAVLVAVPYLILVVAMGYTRQAVAIGILMAGLAAVHRGASTLRFAVYVALASLFHKTAVVALPLVVFSSEKNKVVNIVTGLVASYYLLHFVPGGFGRQVHPQLHRSGIFIAGRRHSRRDEHRAGDAFPVPAAAIGIFGS